MPGENGKSERFKTGVLYAYHACVRKHEGSRDGKQSAFRRGVTGFNSNHVTGINMRHDTSMIHPHCHDSRHVTATSHDSRLDVISQPKHRTTGEIFPTEFQANYSAGKQNFLFSAFTSLNLRIKEIRLRHSLNRAYQRTIKRLTAFYPPYIPLRGRTPGFGKEGPIITYDSLHTGCSTHDGTAWYVGEVLTSRSTLGANIGNHIFKFSLSSSRKCQQHSTNKTLHVHYQHSFPTQRLNVVLWTPSCRR